MIKKGEWIVEYNGDIYQADYDASELTVCDSHYPTKEVAEIRGSVIKADLMARQPTKIFTTQAMVNSAMEILSNELMRSHKEAKKWGT